MRLIGILVGDLLGLAGTAGAQGAKPLKKCPVDAVVSGTACMDKYEASLWRVPDPLGVNKGLVTKLQQAKITDPATLTAAGATQLGVGSDNYAPCADSGQTCADDIFAASLPGVPPSANITWFQAQAACKNARKRLPSVGGNWLERSIVMLVATPSIASGVLRIIWHLLGRDALRSDLKAWREILSFMLVSPAAITWAPPGYFSYFRPGFHPWREDDRPLPGAWMQAYPAVASAPESSRVGDS